MLNRTFFFDAIRGKPFGGSLSSGQVSGMNAILDCWESKLRYTDLRWLAYCLATAFHETARTMQPIEEYGRGRGHSYGEAAGPYGQTYFGRGLVQLTWITNYQRAAAELAKIGIDVDLERQPDLAMRPDVAALILLVGCAEGWFSGRKLGDYFAARTADPVNARRIVNGLDQASAIAGYYFAFLGALREVDGAPAIAAANPPVMPPPIPAPSSGGAHITGVLAPSTAKPGGFWASLWAALTGKAT